MHLKLEAAGYSTDISLTRVEIKPEQLVVM